MTTFFQDCAVMSGRCLKHITRNGDSFINTLAFPVIMMLLFVNVFGGAFSELGGENYINYLVPGVLMISIAMSAATASPSINADISKGLMDRFRSLPISSGSFIVGHVLASVVRTIISTLVVFVMAFIMGFRTSTTLLAWVNITWLLLLFNLSMTSLAVLFGLLANSVEGAQGYTMVFNLLPYVSSGFIPTDTMPWAVRIFANHQPVTVLAEAVRSCFHNAAFHPVPSILWCIGIIAFSLLLSIPLFKRKTS